MTAERVNQESKDARVEFMKEAKTCRNLVRDHEEPTNEQYMDMLKEEIPVEDLDGQVIFDSDIFHVQVKEGQVVDENFIAARRFELRHKLFIYRRKRAMWQSLYRSVKQKVVHPIQCEKSYLSRRINIAADGLGDSASSEDLIKKVELAIKIEERPCCLRWLIRLGAILSITWSVFLLYNESMLIFGNGGSVIAYIEESFADHIWVIFLVTILIQAGTVLAAFLTIFKLKFSDYL